MQKVSIIPSPLSQLLSLVAETGGKLASFPIPDSSLIPVLPCNTSVLTAGEPEEEASKEKVNIARPETGVSSFARSSMRQTGCWTLVLRKT